ncbi:DNA internalization-related competence protein ComEC/Rec2 [Peptoniphilus timonensis]|uniref:DNA internalization-related competence protein ComEC/Rec2 n=1 Tax=Peptoniphilus timonensis TaxID=1268254 RepID=UPI00031859F6|nr:DNA internalization-related competence protein ComEC/Rec2 [Peptoniphilus timonensis]
MYLFAGIIFGLILSIYIKSYFLNGLIILAIILYILSKKNRTKFLYLPLLIFLVILNYNFRDYDLEPFDGNISGKVVSAYENKSIIKTDRINSKKFKTKILVYEKLNRGSYYKLSGNFYPALPAMNKGNFDYEKNNKSQGIYLIGKIKNYKVLSEASGIYKFTNIFKDRAKYFFNKNLNDRNAGLLESLVLGDKSLVDSAERDRFNSLGISHLLAVSGLHIGVIAFLIEFFFKNTIKNKKITDFCVTVILFLYIMAIGFSISAVRAFLFFFLYKGNIYLQRDLEIKDIFFLSLSLILFINPMAIYSISLLLSYGAIFGLVFVYPSLSSKFSSSGFVAKSFLVTLSVLISVFPLINYYFSGFSLFVFIANLIIVPIYSIIISFAFVMGLGIFSGIIGKILNILMNASYGLESLIISKGSIFLSLKAFKFDYIFLYYLLLILIINRHKFDEIIKLNLKIIEIYSFFAFIILGFGIFIDLNTFEISQLYVDQGDGAIISYAGKNYLIDTGGARYKNNIAEKYLFPSLNWRGVSNIDGIFISHFDEDHAGNLEKVLRNYKVKNVFINHLPENKEILKNIKDYSNLVLLEKGDKLKLFKDTSLEVLLDNKDREDENNKSMVLLLNHKGFKALFPGDISAETEKEIKTKVDLLKVAHHGSKTSTSDEFLENIQPKFAVISAAYNNSYGHPHKESLDNLENHDIIYYVTSRDGEVDFKILKDRLKIEKNNRDKDYKLEMILIILNTSLLYFTARKNYELQKDLQR